METQRCTQVCADLTIELHSMFDLVLLLFHICQHHHFLEMHQLSVGEGCCDLKTILQNNVLPPSDVNLQPAILFSHVETSV